MTIRAFGWQERMKSLAICRLNVSQQAFYTLLCLQRWLNIVIDLIVAGLAIGTIALAVMMRGSMTGGDIGVALNVVLVTNTTLLRLVESWATLETSLGAISRMKAMERDTPIEALPHETAVPGVNWPSKGGMVLEKLTAFYK